MLRALFKQGSFWTITNEKAFRDHGSGFGIRRIGARYAPGMENISHALNKPGML